MTGAGAGALTQVVTGPAGDSPARRRLTLAVAYAVGAAVAAGLAWWLAGRGVATDSWPAFAPGADHTEIVRYSGAWLTAAAGAALAAALLLVAAIRRGVRAAAPDRPIAEPSVGGPTSFPEVVR